MSRINASVLWDYFKKISDTKKALCTLCGEEYSFATTTGNLKAHLKKKHKAAFSAVAEAQEQARYNDRGNRSVIYEYVVVPSPTSSVNESTTTECTKANLQSRESLSEKRSKLSQEGKDTSKENRLIEELTEEKIRIANLQKELIEKEMEEKNLKITLLQDEMNHKKLLYELEKYEIEHRKQEIKHKKQINDLSKQEMLLKIEVLNATLSNSR
ncbi:unnamed protein product [Arctia plantaginis]|uniref:BED-type domain-containing protein n=1 Tax=Arctia plantaginis TaxID=874455 RepID=A0A8S1B6C8_ARCPL|nr:unnamed protein product [Arctia plantaginis]